MTRRMTQSIISGGATPGVGGLGTAVPLQPGTEGTTFGIKPQATIVSLSPNRQGVPQVVSPPQTQDVNRLTNVNLNVEPTPQATVQPIGQPTAGASGTGAQKTIVLPTNLKVNMNNKQYKILYVQKPGATKPELCLQLCATDGTTSAGGALQGAVPLVTMQQPLQPVPAATSGRNMQIQMVPQGGNKIVMQAVGGTPQAQVPENVMVQNPLQVAQNAVPQIPLPPQAVHNVVLQNPLAAPQVVNPAAGSNTSIVTMISTPIPPVPPSVYALSTGAHAPLAGMQSQVPAGNAVSVMSAPSVQMASVLQVPSAMTSVSVAPQDTVLAGNPSKAVAEQVVQLLKAGAVAPSVAQPVVRSVAQPMLSQIGHPMTPSGSQPMVSPIGQPMTPSVAPDLIPQTNVILQAASASGLVLPAAPEPSMKQIVVQGITHGSGQ